MLVLAVGCGVAPPARKPLNPRLLFTAGSSFLTNAESVALKGKIEFQGSGMAQTGSYELFISGMDSVSFLVEGPFGSDIFRMVIAGDDAFMLADRDEGWVTLHQGEEIAVAEYGIEYISPFLLGLYAFPQFYLRSGEIPDSSDEYSYRDQMLTSHQGQDEREFVLTEPRSQISAAYGERKEFEGGFYPSQIKIFRPDRDWQITLQIEKIRVNPSLPGRIWRRD